MVNEFNAEQRLNCTSGQAKKYGRLAEYSLDEENRRGYEARAQKWKKLKREHFERVNFKTGGIEVSKYVENEKLSRDLQSRKEKEFGLENSKESINSLYSEATEWENLLTDD